MAPDRYFLTAQQSADVLGISRATLYAYTSRGQLRSDSIPGRPRERRYSREDVERLRDRKEARRDPASAAARGLHWGAPALESGITLIHNGRFYYRGHDAITLAKTSTLEDIATLLWGADERGDESLFRQPSPLSRRHVASLRSFNTDGLSTVQASMPIAGSLDVASYDLSPTTVRRTGGRIVRLVTRIIAGHDSVAPIHLSLQEAWAPRKRAVADVIRTALVLCADHELNVSAFTARCAASAGASPYHVVAAALATFRGYKHGGAADRVRALLAEIDAPRGARGLVAARLRRGERLPGFGHRLYPAGDPRAVELLQCAKASGNDREWTKVRALLRASSELLHDRPNLDFGLAAVTQAYGLPDDAPAQLFALGRTIGWIAHAMEEYASADLIRPRARYTGPAPQTDSSP